MNRHFFMSKFGRKAFAVAVCVLLTVALALSVTNAYSFKVSASSVDIAATTNATSAADASEKARDVNQRIAEEGFTLLKNENSALPLAEGSRKVTVLGKNSVNPVYNGTGSAGGGGTGSVDVYDGLTNAGIECNPALKAFYQNNNLSGDGRSTPRMHTVPIGALTGETPVTSYSDELKATFNEYNDAAVIFISRVGGEGFDLPQRSMNVLGQPIAGHTDINDHYFELDNNEKDLIKLAKREFNKVILVLNVASSFELGFIDSDDLGVDAVINAGFPGVNGLNALGTIITGAVNPSGSLVDTYAKDFTKDPTYQNFASNLKYKLDESVANAATTYVAADGLGNQYKNLAGDVTGAYEVSYEEGIYIGYRYYETRAFVEGGTWWTDNVMFPFGYGQSYTTFDWDVDFKTTAAALTKDGSITVDVTVTNTGRVAGKDAVQLYYSAPYTKGGIEKAHVVLGGFAKTDLIEPNGSDTVTITLAVEDMASYDWSDANNNDFKGYELDAGDYTIYIGQDAHDAWTNADVANRSKVYTVPAGGFTYEIDIDGDSDGNDNQFDDVSDGLTNEMSRADFEGTFPVAPTDEELTKEQDFIQRFVTPTIEETLADDITQPWYVSEMPNQRKTALKGNEEGIILLSDLEGLEKNDPKWDDFMDQLTVEQLADVVVDGFFDTMGFNALGVPVSSTPDGSTGISGGIRWCSGSIVAGTFDVELVAEMGLAWGDEGLWNNHGGTYAPAANIHRSPFSGRNFEYYSEDGFISGTMAALIVKGMQARGIVPLMKHFALNDQETNRFGVATWVTEQTMREIYLKPFQMAVEDGGCLGLMSSFNRLGTVWAGDSYAFLTNVTRKEWGFNGAIITDWAGQGSGPNANYMNLNTMIRAGGDYQLERIEGALAQTEEAFASPTHVAAMRNAAKNVFYMVLHSSADMYQSTATTNLGTAYTMYGNSLSVASTYYGENFGYRLANGSKLPAGMSLGNNGIISGKPTAAVGTYTFMVEVCTMTTSGWRPTLGDPVGKAVFTLAVSDDNDAALTALVTKIADLNNQISSLQGANSSLGTDLEASRELITALKTELNATKTALEDAIAQANGNITADQGKLTELQNKIAELEAALNAESDDGYGVAIGICVAAIVLAVLAAAAVVVIIIVKKKKDLKV